MIKKLTNKDKEDILLLLKKEPAYNLFAIGDIEVYGCEGDVVEVWTQSKNEEIEGFLVRYNNAFLVSYLDENADVNDFSDIIKKHPVKAEFISGRDTSMKMIEKKFEYNQYKKLFFCKLDKPIEKGLVDNTDVIIAKADDAEEICKLQNTIDEFAAEAIPESVARNIENGFARGYLLKNENGDVISMAQTSAENSSSAMIVGVCTHKDYRKRGYMRKVMMKLCYDLQQENKLTCLFYDNKNAGRIYHSIGFETIGMWHTIVLKK